MNPYKIGPYSEDDSACFWGRSQEIKDMYKSFMQNDYLICYANSGEGKSSILNAGLFPLLRINTFFPINIRFKFDENEYSDLNFDRIINDIINQSLGETKDYIGFEPKPLYESGNDDYSDMKWQNDLVKNSLWLRLRYSELLIKKNNGETSVCTPVLVFDQFEEVFTNPQNEIWTKAFFQWLEELSTDVCPSRIAQIIEEHNADIDLSMMFSGKRFKAIFSLRSEYVGNVDYWGLQHFYIPDLKNNRFFLKPLLPEGAIEVVKQPNGLQLSDETCMNLMQGCSESEELVKENLPCIPASILSIVCHELWNLNEEKTIKYVDSLVKDRNAVVEKVLENYYLQTLLLCGIKDERSRDALERALVDDKGNRNRVRVKHKDLQILSENQIKMLIDAKMLRVVSKAKSEDDLDGDIVELPHDRFCKFILNHKKKRFDEIQIKNRNLKEWLVFGVICAVLGICSWLIHSTFVNMMKPIINMCMAPETKLQDIVKLLLKFCRLDSVPDNFILGLGAFGCIFIYVFFLPCIFLFFTQKLKKITLVFLLSSIPITSVTVYRVSCLFGRQTDSHFYVSFFVVLSALLISLVVLLLLIMKWKKMGKTNIRFWPLWGGWTLFSFYLLSEFVFGLQIGVSNPCDSWFFVFLIPVLLFLCSTSYFEVRTWNHSIKGIQCDGKYYYTLAFFSILLLWLIAYNNYLPYLNSDKLNKVTVYILLITFGALEFCLLWNVSSMSKRILIFFINYFVFIFVFVLNLGYNIFKIDYDRVAVVSNWRSVSVKDSSGNMYGIYNPINGDTIFPMVIDKGYIGENEFEVCSQWISNSQDTCNSDSSYYIKNGIVHIKFLAAPTLEEYIFRMNRHDPEKLSREFQMDYYAVKLFEELRNASIAYAVNSKAFSMRELSSWKKLYDLQIAALEKELDDFNINNLDTVRRHNDSIRVGKINVLEDKHICGLYSALARSFYLCSLRDRVVHNDISSVMTQKYLYALLFFTSVPRISYTYKYSMNLNIQADWGDKIQHAAYISNIFVRSQDVLEGKAFAWYDLFNSLCYFDICINAPKYEQAMINPKLLEFMNDFLHEAVELQKSADEVKKIVDVTYYKKKIKEMLNRRRRELEKNGYDFDTEKADANFIELKDRVFGCLYPAMCNNPVGIYNNAFEMTCKNLTMVQMFRQYNVKKDLDRINKYDSLRNDMYETLKNINGMSNQVVTNFKDELLKLSDKIQ